ncbi:MAG: hypothetical protein WD577_12175 [Bacteroidales bacterium]
MQLAEDLLKFGFLLSFGESLLEVDKAREAFAGVPLEKFFLETDESDVPIGEIYSAAAEIRGASVESLRLHMFEKSNNCRLAYLLRKKLRKRGVEGDFWLYVGIGSGRWAYGRCGMIYVEEKPVIMQPM